MQFLSEQDTVTSSDELENGGIAMHCGVQVMMF